MLTPRTIFGRNKEIIAELKKTLGPIEADIENSERKDESTKSMEESMHIEELLVKKNKERMKRLSKKFGIGGEQIQAKIKEGKVTAISRIIIKYWVTRMRFLRKLRLFVQNTVDLNLATECLYCRYTYGLQVELLQSLEDMFYDYLKE